MITLETIQQKQTELAALIQQLASHTTHLIFPKFEVELRQGERYAGTVLSEDGRIQHHLVLMAQRPATKLTWAAAMEWAESVEGSLPTRQEQALLYANCKPHLDPSWQWSCESHEEDASCAWGCYFGYGGQLHGHKSYEGSAVAVRRFSRVLQFFNPFEQDLPEGWSMTRKTTPYGRKRAQGRATRAKDGITTSRTYTTRLRPAEVATILQPCKRALQAMRTASATHRQWVVLCSAGHVAEAIEDGGIIRGQRAIINQANQALADIGTRCGLTPEQWHPGPCHGHELTALADMLAAHSRQVHELTYAEYTTAFDRAVARVASDGGQVFRMEEVVT